MSPINLVSIAAAIYAIMGECAGSVALSCNSIVYCCCIWCIRFSDIIASMVNTSVLGVEMEVASYTRNNLPEPDEDSWMYNFELYLQAAKNHSWDTNALKVWFHGGSFLEYWRGCYPVVTAGPRACNLTDNARKRHLYDQIYWMIKGSWPLPPTGHPGYDGGA